MPGATEARHGDAKGLEALPSADILRVMLDTQLTAVGAIALALPAIGAAGDLAAQRLSEGGRLIYAGAGSSGLMAMADGLELPGTFGIDPQNVKILLAGGQESLVRLAGGYEDDRTLADADADRIGLRAGDCVVCVTASGSTPYTIAIAEKARHMGAAVIGIANNADAALFSVSDVAVLLNTPPEVVAGSTRMGAGTAQKIALNMLSTLMAMRLGHVHDGYMINLMADNAKLHERACRIVADISGVGFEVAAACLKQADGSVKLATLIASGAPDAERASRLLANCNQNFPRALELARAGM